MGDKWRGAVTFAAIFSVAALVHAAW